MTYILKKIIKHIYAFVCNQYLVLFFTATTSLKLYLFSTYVIKVTWSLKEYNQGIVFSILTAALLFSPFYFFKKYKNKFTVTLAILISALLFIDTLYFSYFKSLPTTGLLGSLGQTQDVIPAIIDLYQWRQLLYFADIAMVIIFRKPIFKFFKNKKRKIGHIKHKGLVTSIVTVAIVALFINQLFVIGINRLSEVFDRGFDTKSTAQLYGVLGAHMIDISRSIKQEFTTLSPQDEKKVIDWIKKYQPSQSKTSLTGIAKGKNIIIVQVESLGGFVINQKVNNKEITPNLNVLAQNSQFFPNDRFVIGAGHTSDTDLVANTSFFPLDDAATFVRYGKDNFSSLPKALVSNGYSAFVYHGYNRDFWNRNTALKSIGYQKFYAADNYPDGAKINMGLNDGDFLSKTADYIKDQPKPSLNYSITLSSHVPFEITDQTKELGIDPNNYPQQVGGYLENINYTDRMIGKFFEKLKSYNLYEDSLIIVFGDHTPVLSSFTAGTISYNPGSVQEKEVPLFIKLPKGSGVKNEIYPNKGTHLDITPTILDLAGIQTKQLMFGQSLFADKASSLKTCNDQLSAFPISNNCQDSIKEEKLQSETIIRYNLFNKLPK